MCYREELIRFVVNAKGEKVGVLLSIKEYQRLMEDLHDLAIVAERRDEKPISLDELRQHRREANQQL